MPDPVTRLNTALEGRYRIERELGEGGMATVYRADDVRHDRKVALKVLKRELAAVVGADRFLAEIKTTANLQHPHILPLFDSGEADGLPFYVMPLIEGESLQDRLEREGPLPVEDAIRLAAECGEALDYAHQQGVIHRDVKPANVLLSGGHALLADFGVATAVNRAANRNVLTATGAAVGTLGYMSPEQASGEHEVDSRADVYAVGCVLYEMLAGEQPFQGATPMAVMTRQLDGPGSVTTIRPSVPQSVEMVIRKACEPTPGDRYRSAAEFTRALREPRRAVAPAGGRSRWGMWIAAAAVALLLIGGGAWLGMSREANGRGVGLGEVPVLAVLPLENLSPAAEDAFFTDGIHQDIQTQLSKLSGLTVLARQAVMPYRDTVVSIPEIAGALGANAVLAGSLRRALDQVRIDLQLVDPVTEVNIWAETYTRRLDATNVFDVQAEIARSVAEALEVTMSREEEGRIARRPTESLAAYDLFLKGQEAYPGPAREDNDAAVRFYREALAIDSAYAPAWAGLALSFGKRVWGLSQPLEWADSAVQHAEQALELDGELALGHSALAIGFSVQERRGAAIDAHRRAIELDPSGLFSVINLGFELRDVGRFDEALPWLHRGVVLDPTHVIPRSNLQDTYRSLMMDEVSAEWLASLRILGSEARIRRAHSLREQGALPEALALAEEEFRMAAEGREARALVFAAEVAYLARDFQRAGAWAEEASRLAPDNLERNSWYGKPVLLGLTLTSAGEAAGREILQQAIDLYDRWIDEGADYWMFPWGIGVAQAALGNDDAALEWLEQAYDAGFRILRLARDEPAFDRLRGNPGFEEWMSRIETDVAEMRERAIEHDRRAGLR